MILLGGAIRLSAHVLVGDPLQLRSQLHGRLSPDWGPDIERVLKDAGGGGRSSVAAAHFRPSLSPPGGPLLLTLEGHEDRVDAVAVFDNDQKAISAIARSHAQSVGPRNGAADARALGTYEWSQRTVAVFDDGRKAISALL